MKRCSQCGTEYPDDANFCPNDGGRLDQIAAQPAAPAATGGNVLDGRFTLGAPVGMDATGQLLAAKDAQTGADCLVRMISPQVAAGPMLAQRIDRELKQLEKVAADGVLRVLGSGHQGEQMWVATELVQAPTLLQVVAQSGPLPPPRALKIAREAGEALAEAAKQGVIHRDVCPQNLLVLAGDHVKVQNFALPVPTSDRLQGVPEFMSPEQAEGKPVDQRSNIYGLGALLYYMLTGEPPFAGDPQTVAAQVVGTPPVPPTLKPAGAAIPAEIERLVLRALEKSSAKRHMTLRQMLSELEAVATGAPQPEERAAAKTIIGGFGAMPAVAPPPAQPVPMAAAAPQPVAPAPAPAPAPIAATMMASPQAPVMPAPAAPQAPVMPAPAAPQAPVMPAAPVAPAAPAAPQAPAAAPAGGKNKKSEAPPPAASKGKFRETMWFKKGELDEAAAEAAAQAKQSGADGLPVSDKADEMSIDERYKDDGSISAKDREKFSLRTGATQMMPAVEIPDAAPTAKVAEKELVEEMRGGRGKIIAIAVVIVLAIGGVIAWQALGGGDKKDAAGAVDAGAAAPTPPAPQ